MEGIIKEFNDTGVCEINTDEVVKKWNRLWVITEWRRDDSWRLIKYLRKDSPITCLKVTISKGQARELMNSLDLKGSTSNFVSGFSYRRDADWTFLD